ncbi:MAG: hypothetical protein ABI777_04510 [Betaproteobacteria bacterium]
MLNLDPNTLLAIESSALAILVALGIWRLVRDPDAEKKGTPEERTYDMRRDGQRLST